MGDPGFSFERSRPKHVVGFWVPNLVLLYRFSGANHFMRILKADPQFSSGFWKRFERSPKGICACNLSVGFLRNDRHALQKRIRIERVGTTIESMK